MVQVRPVTTPRDRQRFLQLPWTIYADDPAWVPPLLAEEKKLLNPRRNPFFRHAKVQLFLAEADGRALGRVAAVVDERSNRFHNENVGLFGFFESVNDTAVSNALLTAAAKWVREMGAEKLRGPIDLSTNERVGLLMEGHGEPPVFLMTYQPPYYAELLEAFGLEQEEDLVSFQVPVQRQGGKIARVAAICARKGYTLRTIRMKDFDKELQIFREIFNEAWENNWGFVPMDDAEFDFMAKGLKQIVVPEFALIAEREGEAAGVLLALPDLNEILRPLNGRLLPFGWLKLMRTFKNIRGHRVIIMGVRKAHRNRGIDAMLVNQIAINSADLGYKTCDFGWVLERNDEMRNLGEALAGAPYRRYRIFCKEL